MVDETGIYLLKNLREEKIDLRIHTFEDDIDIFRSTALKPDKNELLKYLASFFRAGETNDPELDKWNSIRLESLYVMIQYLLTPVMSEQLEKELQQNAGKVSCCNCKSF